MFEVKEKKQYASVGAQSMIIEIFYSHLTLKPFNSLTLKLNNHVKKIFT
jgi:hypothetical protein